MMLTAKTSTVALTLLALALACSKSRNNSGGGGSNPPSAVNDPSTSDLEPVKKEAAAARTFKAAEPVKAGVKNFAQVQYSLEALTGISRLAPANGGVPAIATVFAREKSGLPASSKIDELTPANIKSVTSLAAIFWRHLIMVPTNVPARTAFFGSTVDFTQAPAAMFASPDAMLGALMDKAWGTGLSALGDRASQLAALKQLVTELQAALPAADKTTIVGSQKVLVAVMATLSGLDLLK